MRARQFRHIGQLHHIQAIFAAPGEHVSLIWLVQADLLALKVPLRLRSHLQSLASSASDISQASNKRAADESGVLGRLLLKV